MNLKKVPKPRSFEKDFQYRKRSKRREDRGPPGCQGGPAGVPPELKGRGQSEDEEDGDQREGGRKGCKIPLKTNFPAS